MRLSVCFARAASFSSNKSRVVFVIFVICFCFHMFPFYFPFIELRFFICEQISFFLIFHCFSFNVFPFVFRFVFICLNKLFLVIFCDCFFFSKNVFVRVEHALDSPKASPSKVSLLQRSPSAPSTCLAHVLVDRSARLAELSVLFG